MTRPIAPGEGASCRAGSLILEQLMATDVAANIREKIQSGVLPLPPEPPQKCYVGKGTRRACDGCDEFIAPDQMEYELDISDSRTLRFHDTRLTAWHAARAERMTE
jgi:hypothetical protein